MSRGQHRLRDLDRDLTRQQKMHRAETGPGVDPQDDSLRLAPPRTKRTFTWAYGQGLSIHFCGEGRVTLLEGEALTLGRKLEKHKTYHWTDRGVLLTSVSAVARVELDGSFDATVVTVDSSADEIAALLGASRLSAAASNGQGPVVLIVGPQDTGKSTLFSTLVNRAVQSAAGSALKVSVAAVDIDVGQTSVSCPGSISAAFVSDPLDVDDEFQALVPLSFFFGDKSVSQSTLKRYLDCCTSIRRCLDAIASQHNDFAVGGTIINTMGWVEGLGLEILMQAINIFRVTHVVVSGGAESAKLVETMSQVAKSSVRGIVVRSYNCTTGIFRRTSGIRIQARDRRIATYFFGTPRLRLTAVVVTVELAQLKLLDARNGEPIAASDIQPLSLAAVSRATDAEGAMQVNAAGFVVWVEAGQKAVRLLAPCSGPLPGAILLVSTTIRAHPSVVPMPTR